MGATAPNDITNEEQLATIRAEFRAFRAETNARFAPLESIARSLQEMLVVMNALLKGARVASKAVSFCAGIAGVVTLIGKIAKWW